MQSPVRPIHLKPMVHRLDALAVTVAMDQDVISDLRPVLGTVVTRIVAKAMDVLHQTRHHSLVLMEDATRNAALTDVVLLSTMANNNRILSMTSNKKRDLQS